MYEGLRLTELHEEWANAKEREARYATYMPKLGARTEADMLDAEIRARVAAQEIGPPYDALCCLTTPRPLLYGIPDAVRKYPGRYDHWSYHARHAVPVEGCHLCHPQPTRWTPEIWT